MSGEASSQKASDWVIAAGSVHAGAWELGAGCFSFSINSKHVALEDGFSVVAAGLGLGGNASGKSLDELRGRSRTFIKPTRQRHFSLRDMHHTSAIISSASAGIGASLGASKGFLLLTANNCFDVEFTNLNLDPSDITVGSGAGILCFAGMVFVHSLWTQSINELEAVAGRTFLELTPWGSTGPWRGLPF